MNTSKLVRPKDGRMLAGICTGLARHLGLDVTLVRLLWVFSVIFLGFGVLAYVICWFVIPEE